VTGGCGAGAEMLADVGTLPWADAERDSGWCLTEYLAGVGDGGKEEEKTGTTGNLVDGPRDWSPPTTTAASTRRDIPSITDDGMLSLNSHRGRRSEWHRRRERRNAVTTWTTY